MVLALGTVALRGHRQRAGTCVGGIQEGTASALFRNCHSWLGCWPAFLQGHVPPPSYKSKLFPSCSVFNVD